MTSALIQDGYNFSATLEALGPFPGFLFRYRPALAEQILEFLHQRDLVAGKAQLKPMIDFLAAHLIGWNIQDHKGDIAPFTPDNLRRVPLGQLNQMLDHIMGYAKGQAEQDVKNSAPASA